MSEVELTGTNPITYPELATWEWPVPAYLFIGGLVAGLMILTGVFRLRKMDRFATALRGHESRSRREKIDELDNELRDEFVG